MAETAKRLDAAIRELESQLREIDDLDPSARKALSDALSEIQAKLQSPGGGPSNWTSRLTSVMADIEASHPGLATMVTRVCDFLDQAGV
jgi:hypothetical protein